MKIASYDVIFYRSEWQVIAPLVTPPLGSPDPYTA